MKLRERRFYDNGVSTVVSAILAITIVVSVVSAVLFYGIPYINKLTEKENLENAENNFNAIIDEINDMLISGGGDKNVIEITSEEGSISMSSGDLDRTIVMYSYIDNLDFYVTGLDIENVDDTFNLNNYGSINNVNVYEIDSEGKLNSVASSFNAGEVKLNSGDFKYNMTIDLLDNSRPDPIVGKIWFFDSNPFEYEISISEGTSKMFLEKGGIIYSKNNINQIKKPINIYWDGTDDYFAIHVLQTVLDDNSFSTGNGFDSRISIENPYVSAREQAKNVHNVRLQFFGDHSDLWEEYIDNKYDDADINYNEVSDTLLVNQGSEVSFSFISSQVTLDMV